MSSRSQIIGFLFQRLAAGRGVRLCCLSLLLRFACSESAIAETASPDWLISSTPTQASVRYDTNRSELVLENGLVRRVLKWKPGVATVAIDQLSSSQRLLRSVRPELELVLNGTSYRIGGLGGQVDHAYLTDDWVQRMTNLPSAFQPQGFSLGQPEAPFAWRRTRLAAAAAWPPVGKALVLSFAGSDALTTGVQLQVHYEIYDGVPVLGKYFTLRNGTDHALTLDRVVLDRLAIVEAESAVDTRERFQWTTPAIDVLSDYMFKGMDPGTATQISSWQTDPEYGTQVSYEKQTPCLLVCQPTIGPGVTLKPGETFTSFRAYLVVHDSSERERRSLGLRRAWKTLAPWTTENPLMMHVRSAKTDIFREAVNQCADVGFEMIIYTFGSGLDMENTDPAYWAKVKTDVDYAHAKGIQVGGYSLFSSRRIDDANDAINPKTMKPGGAIFGNAPCLGSQWGLNYLTKITNFIQATGLDLLEHDGPYPGDVCASTQHPGHHGLEDSQWEQWRLSYQLYSWCRARGVYVNQPDCYFLAGGNKTAMGYRESNWSLPRAQQMIHARQNIFDGTWNKSPSMGWMFVPLTEYQGGGAAATLEPLKEHLPEYGLHLANTLGAGVQACWRGPRLYDAPETRDLVKKWVSWYKKYRPILESDLIHGVRADGQNIDYYLHVNPTLPDRAMLVVFNPIGESQKATLRVPLYYSGLTRSAKFFHEDRKSTSVSLNRQSEASIPVALGPFEVTWFIVRR